MHLETGSHTALAGLNLNNWMRMTLNFSFSSFYVLRVRITDGHQYTQFVGFWELNPGQAYSTN